MFFSGLLINLPALHSKGLHRRELNAKARSAHVINSDVCSSFVLLAPVALQSDAGLSKHNKTAICVRLVWPSSTCKAIRCCFAFFCFVNLPRYFTAHVFIPPPASLFHRTSALPPLHSTIPLSHRFTLFHSTAPPLYSTAPRADQSAGVGSRKLGVRVRVS